MSRHRILIPETVIEGRRLGRHILIDSDNELFPADTATAVRSMSHASSGLPLDQGQIGSCTANALVGALNTVPHWAAGQPVLSEVDAVALYSAETALEGQPYPPNDPGGTGIEVCQAAKTWGWLSSYQHATTLQHALLALTARPIIIGINWYSSFDDPDPDGLVSIKPGSYRRGGHEVLATEIDTATEQIGLWNSWGTGYGVGGRFRMSFDTLARLLSEGGDATVPRTRKGWVAQPRA